MAFILTEEERKALEGLTPFHTGSTAQYTPAAYEGVPEKLRPSFELRPLKKDESERLRKTLAGGVKTTDEAYLREIVRILIVGMKNLYDSATGQLIEYVSAPDGGMDKELYSTLPIHITSDILIYASRISGLLPPEKVGLTS